VPQDELPEGALFGLDTATFVIDVAIYLPWLQKQAVKQGVEFHRVTYTNICDLFRSFPGAQAYFNCTGLGSYSLKGVEDKLLLPSRGQTVLVENPHPPLTQMYTRASARASNRGTYIFPRGPNGPVLLGGCWIDNDWSGEIDMDMAQDIMKQCCALAPELGRPEDLKVIAHQVGLRPKRKGGARIERTILDREVLIHNYGSGGAGYQASWGMANEAVDLLVKSASL